TGGEALGGLFVDFDDDVARAQACVVSRSADVRSHHNGVIFARGDDHSDAVVAATLILAEERELAGIKEIRVRIEDAQHAGNGTLIDLLVDVNGLSVIGLDDVENLCELPDGDLVIVGRGSGGADRGSVNAAENGGNEKY